MKAVVQWFVRMCEIPDSKRKLLGRDAHPQEIFYYKDRSYDNEVDAQTILGTVQVCVRFRMYHLRSVKDFS